MKKKTLIYCALALATWITGASCTKDFQELNTNPNTSEKALPETMLAPALNAVVSSNMSCAKDISNELMQVTVNTLVETDRVFRYDLRRTVAEAPWRQWYVQLTNFKEIYRFASETNKPGYMAISLVCQAWIYSLITDTYGDAPYSMSNLAKEGVYTPSFDRQKDIYLGLFAMLEEANTLFRSARDVLNTSDPVYGGKVALWRKFGNSLYLRLLLRASGNSEVSEDAIARISDMVEVRPDEYPIMASNAESAVLKWNGLPPYVSPFSNLTNAEWRRPKACSFFVDHLDRTADPCISRWLTLVDGLYEGIPSGYAYGLTPDARSYMSDGLKSDPLTGTLMNYAELQFLLAEAALKGWISANPAKTYYENGVTARITLWGRTVGTFLAGELVKWDDALPEEEKMERLMHQKYYALLYTDMQQWCEYRRTGYPTLPKGPGLMNDGVMPTRLYYPVTVQASNSVNYNAALAIQGPDDLKTLLWWQKK